MLALLAASAVLAAPAPEDKEAVATAAADAPAEALLYDVDSKGATHHKGGRNKKQTTTICVQVTPGRPGHAPAVLCGDRDEVDEQKRRMELQRVLAPTTVQVQPQAGYFGSPHVVQIVPAADTNSVTIEAAGRGEPLLAMPSAAPSFTVVTGNAPYFRAAQGQGQPQGQGPQQAPRASEQPAEQPQQPQQQPQQAAETKPAAPQGHSLSDVFAASAPPLPAEAAADHANKAQARSYGDEEIIVTKPAYGGYGPHGHQQQQITVVSEGPSMYGGSQVDIIQGGPRPGGFHGGYPGGSGGYPGGSGGYPVPGGFEDQGGYPGGHQGGFHDFGQPPMMDNFRAAEVAAAERPAQQQQQQQQQAAPASQQARTALLLQQPVVVRKDVVIPAIGESTLSVGGPALRVLPVNAVPVVPALPPLWPQQVAVRQQAPGQASIPITLNCDLSTLQYRGSPAEQLQLSLGRPGPVGNARAAEQAAATADEAKLKQTLGAAMDAAVSNSTVTVNLNGATAQAGDLAKLQQELTMLQQREKMLYETIQSLKAAGQQDHGAAIVGLQAAAEQITKARAAVEQAILQPGAMAGEPAPAPSPKAADGDAFGNMQSMTAAGLQERMRAAGQFRYVSEPGLGLGMGMGFNNGPSSSVVVGMTPSVHGVGMAPVHQQTTTVVKTYPAGGPGLGHYPTFQSDYRAAQPAQQKQLQQQQQQQQQKPQPAPAQPQPAQPAQQREAEQPLLQPAVAGSPATQQKLLQQLREAQEDMLRMRAATLPEARQASGDADADQFPPTPGYQLLPKAADATPATPTFTQNAGPSYVSAPTSPTQTYPRQAYWGR